MPTFNGSFTGRGQKISGTDVDASGTVFIQERADAQADEAGKGQLWVDNQTPCELYFTTDAGNDIQITSGTGLVSGTISGAQTGITSVVNASLEIGRDADNRIKFGTDNQIIFEIDGGDNVIFKTSGEIEASSLDISGDADIDGTLEADAITVNGDTLAEVIQDTVGAMVGSNTETGISVTYEDGDGTLDFVLDAVGTAAIADDAVTVAKIEDLARGQIIYGNASAETAKLSPGSNGTVLTSDGTDISWQAAAGGSAADDENAIIHAITLGF